MFSRCWDQRLLPLLPGLQTSDPFLCCSVDPFSRKDWYDVKAPSVFNTRNVGKTLVTRTQGTKVSLTPLVWQRSAGGGQRQVEEAGGSGKPDRAAGLSSPRPAVARCWLASVLRCVCRQACCHGSLLLDGAWPAAACTAVLHACTWLGLTGLPCPVVLLACCCCASVTQGLWMVAGLPASGDRGSSGIWCFSGFSCGSKCHLRRGGSMTRCACRGPLVPLSLIGISAHVVILSCPTCRSHLTG